VGIADCGLRIADFRSWLSHFPVAGEILMFMVHGHSLHQSAIRNPQSAIRNPHPFAFFAFSLYLHLVDV
jgi:hypothetical protein